MDCVHGAVYVAGTFTLLVVLALSIKLIVWLIGQGVNILL
jgi:hypothetical protein